MIFKIACEGEEAKRLGDDLVGRFERAQIETFCMIDPLANLLVNVTGNHLQLQAVGIFLRNRYAGGLMKPSRLDRISIQASLDKARKAHAQRMKRKIIRARFIPLQRN